MRLTRQENATLALCTALLVLLGWLDYVTGYEFGVFVFYSLPVGLAAYRVGLRSGLVMALASTAVWFYADRLTGQRYSSNFMFWWNSAVRCGCFVINAVSMVKIREHVEVRRKLERELAAARAEAEVLRRKLAESAVPESSAPPRDPDTKLELTA